MEGMRSRQTTIDEGHMMQENSQGIHLIDSFSGLVSLTALLLTWS